MRVLFLYFLFLPIAFIAQSTLTAYDTAFVRTFGGVNFDEARDIKEAPDKGFIIVGTTSSFGQGSTSLYVVKTDSLANHKWSRNYGGINNDWGYSVENTFDGGFLFTGFSNSFGSNSYDGYVLKTDNTGNQLWQKTYGDYDWDFLYNSFAMPDSGYVLCGETYSNTAGNADAWLVRINKNGDTLWTKKYGSYEDEKYNAVSVYNNRIYAVGKAYNLTTNKFNAIVNKYDFDGNLAGTYIYALTDLNAVDTLQDFEFKNINKTIANQLVLTGLKSYKPDSMSSIVMQIDTSFNACCSNLGGYQSTKVMNRSLENSKNKIITVGTANGGLGGTAMTMFSFFSNGAYNDAASFGGTHDEEGYSSVITNNRRMAFVGSTNSIGFGDKDMYLIFMKKDTLIHDNKQVFYYYQDTLPLTVVDVKEIGQDKNVKIYPNPFSDRCYISITGLEKNETVNINIYDVLGNLILTKKVVLNDLITIDRANFSAGTYIISITGRDMVIRKKLVIE